MHDPSHDPKRQAARTTIVGGQPPGNSRALTPVPVGLEELLAMASTSAAFAEALRREPLRTAEAARIELSPAERAILGSVGDHALGSMIARVRPAVAEPERRAFLERAAAAVALVVGAAALPACEGKQGSAGSGGSGNTAPRKPHDRPPTAAGGVRVDRPEPTPPAGIRPDRPPRPPEPPRPDAGASSSACPQTPETPTRARPSDRHNDGGSRPERRSRVAITGIRPKEELNLPLKLNPPTDR